MWRLPSKTLLLGALIALSSLGKPVQAKLPSHSNCANFGNTSLCSTPRDSLPGMDTSATRLWQASLPPVEGRTVPTESFTRLSLMSLWTGVQGGLSSTSFSLGCMTGNGPRCTLTKPQPSPQLLNGPGTWARALCGVARDMSRLGLLLSGPQGYLQLSGPNPSTPMCSNSGMVLTVRKWKI